MKAKTRVLHLIDSLDLGGAQTVLLAWLRCRDCERFDAELAAMHGTRKSLFHARAAELGIPVHLLAPLRWVPSYLVSLPWLLASRRYDVVHCHLFVSNWLGKPLAKLLRVPVLVSHDYCNDDLRSRSRLITSIDRWANQFADWIYVVSASIKDFLVSTEKISPSIVQVIPTGVAEDKDLIKRRTSGKVIGAAGRLVAQKNFERFLHLAKALHDLDQDYKFVVAGGGPLEGHLRRLSEDFALPIKWLGTLPSLREFFAQIDLFLLTSDYEGLPVTLLEALYFKVPAAATAVDGIAEQFQEEVFLLDPTSSIATMASRIHQLMNNPTQRTEMAERGHAFVNARFLASAQIAQIELKYIELLSSGGKARPN